MYAAQTPLTRQYVYVFGAFGLIILASTLLRLARSGLPKVGLPRPTFNDLASAAGWVLLAIMIWVTLSRLR